MNSGWYLMLEPLSRGQHTIHFSATIPGFGDFSFDVTYHLNVGKPSH